MPTAVVRSFVEALERQDLDAAIECVDGGVYFVSESAAEGDDFSAHEGFRRWWDLQISGGFDIHPLRVERLDDHHVFAELLTGHAENDGSSWAAETSGCICTLGDRTAERRGTIEVIEMFADADRALARARRTIEEFRRAGLLQDN